MIAVVGSINRDIVVTAPRLPGPGETVEGTGHFESAGGKGANQAVAAARLGGDVALFGAVGDDAAGRGLLTGLEAAGVATDGVRVADGTPSGLAVVTVDTDGENTIVGVPGANGTVSAGDVAAWEPAIVAAAVVLLQLEIPEDAVAAAVAAASGTVVLNPAPARTISADTLGAVDVLVPNRIEAALLTGSDRLEALVGLAPTIVVTLGADGAAIVADTGITLVPAPEVTAVDSTGAGDAFCGALAVSLAAGVELEPAVVRAVHAGALATKAPGARSALPTAAALDGFIEASD